MYLILNLLEEINTNAGKVHLANGDCMGMLPVFRTKKAAREYYPHSECIKIEMKTSKNNN